MAGDLAARTGRLVAERHGTERDRVCDLAADAAWRRIMIAGDPDPVAADLQIGDAGPVVAGETLMCLAVMKAVAERDHSAGIVVRDHGGKPLQGRNRVERRQEGAARGEARPLFQMQVGDDEQALRVPHQRTGEIDPQRGPGDVHHPR